MNCTDRLMKCTGPLKSKVGAAFVGSHAIFRGRDLHRELRDYDWVALYMFGITGREPTQNQVEMVRALWVYTSYPDSRLWNNRVAALSGSARSSANLGVIAGLAVSEATVYGTGVRIFDFLQRALRRRNAGEDLETLVMTEAKTHRISGYGRPVNSTDERLPWVKAKAVSLGFADGPYFQLAHDVEKILLLHYPQLRMNYASLQAAIMADMGFSVREYQLLRVPMFLAAISPCQIEGAEKPEGAIYATPCTGVNYTGIAPRKWK
jgi:hypothetical protein